MNTACRFCADPASKTCAWPVERFEETEVGQLQVGDIVRRYEESKRTDWSVATVEHISRIGELLRVTLSIRTKTWAVRGKVFEANDFQRCRRRVMAPCGVLVCEKHVQVRGPGHYLCFDHWNAWEAAA